MMQPQVNSNSAVPITSTAGILNFDHYKYVRSILPSIPHFIESLSFTDLNNWECQIYVNLLNESDCTKWLTDFEEKTNTFWKADKDASQVVSQAHKTKGCVWQMIYKLMDSKKDCPGKLEMRLFGHDQAERNRKQYPCQVNINYYTNQNTTNSTVFNMESFKSQDIPSHLKEGFEGYFQDLQPVTQSGPTTINLHALKPHPPSMLNSPLTHTLASNSQSSPPLVLKSEGNIDGKLVAATVTNGQEMAEMPEVEHKLDNALLVLRRMMKESGPAVTAVKHFVDKFEKLQGDQNQLEDALTSFGGQWDWLVAGTEAGVSISQAPPLMTMAPVTTTPLPHQQLITTQHPQVHSPSQDLSPKTKKAKKKIKLDEKEVAALTSTPQSVFSTNIVGGQIVLQQQQPQAVTPSQPGQAGAHTPVSSIMDSDAKKRKRARCGNCTGCLNRDKTQDCRQCRNCLDQKRYGGPGRLKKACIKRQCVVITQINPGDAAPSEVKVNTVSAVKSEPTVFSVKTEAGSEVSLAPAPVTSQASAPTLLSWPSGAYTPTFQVQVPQQVQFAFQPQSYGGVTSSQSTTLQGLQPLQYTTAVPGQTLQTALTATQLGAV